MKKNILLITIFAVVSTGIFAQLKPGKTITPQERNCGTMNNVSQQNLQNLEDALAPQIAAYMQAQANGGSLEAVYTIPTIVHVIHNTTEGVGSGRNIPNARILEQIQILNDDFRRTNSDANGTWSQAADCEINFCLITTYPSGHAQAGLALSEVGVDRVSTADIAGISNTSSGYSMNTVDNTIKPATSWNPNEVMNIWVCQLQGGLLGYATFPNTGPADEDGTVMGYQYFGLTGGPFGLGRTTTHEVGHWLSCYHIWGDDGGSCGGSDLCGDTPNQGNSTGGCPSGVQTDACAGAPDGYMYQNYMDYSNDACMNLFTADQKARMQSTMATQVRRSTLNAFSATLCAPIGTANDDAGITTIIAPIGTACGGSITPTVTLRNYGSNTLTAVTINYLVDGVPQTPYAWSGSLVTNTSIDVNLPSISPSNGAHTFDANTTMPNGTTDQDPANDAVAQGNFSVISTGSTLPFFEGFEGTYLPTGFTANNDDGVTTWAKTTIASKSGSASAFMDYYNYSTSKGEEDDIITPAVDLTSATNPQVTFELAYQLYTDPGDPTPFSDTLEVLISTDCGISWTSLYRKESTNLTTTTPTFSTASFVPSANQWRMETISLAAYSTASAAMIMFRGIGDYENQLYIDDINIEGTVGIETNSITTNVNIFPNPATDVINVSFNTVENSKIVVFNLVGEIIYNNTNVLNRINKIDMSKHANGVYFIKVKSGDQIMTKKIILVK